MSNTPVEPWTNSKRVGIALLGTSAILLLAIVFGGGIYRVFSFWGIFPFIRPVEERVVEQVLSDPNILGAVHRNAKTRHCEIPDFGIGFSFIAPLREMELIGHPRCSLFYLPSSSGQGAQVKLSTVRAEVSLVVAEKALDYDQVYTDVYAQHNYSGSILTGVVDGIERTIYVLSLGSEKSLMIDYVRSDPAYAGYVEDLVQSVEPL